MDMDLSGELRYPTFQQQGPFFSCNLLPTEHLGVLKNSLKRVRAFQIELEFESVE